MRFKLVLEYTGTRYRGWQIQKNARTVQGDLREVIAEVSGRDDFELYGSGRTDAGVHALGQVAHLELETRLKPDALCRSFNEKLPSDIYVLSLERSAPRFHARHSAAGRSYLYQISRRKTAFGKPYVWWVRDPLSVDRMREAAVSFVGMHDFRSFTDQKPKDGSTKVLVDGVALAEERDLILVRILGSHFLWKMVRRMVGVLVGVGRGALTKRDLETFLKTPSGEPAKLTAPPSGLFLERVFYEDDERDFPLVGTMRIGSHAVNHC